MKKSKKLTKEKIADLWKRYKKLSDEQKEEALPRVWGWMEAEFSENPAHAKAFFEGMESQIVEAEKKNGKGFFEGWL